MSDKLRTANLLAALAGVLTDRMDVLAKEHHNQTDTAMAALNIITHFDGCSISQMSAALKLSHSAAVRLVDKLRQAGLVDISEGPDRRTLALHATSEGQRRTAHLVSQRIEVVARILGELSEGERSVLANTISRLLEQLTTSPMEAAHICRLCDDMKCPPETCPVHLRAEQLAVAM